MEKNIFNILCLFLQIFSHRICIKSLSNILRWKYIFLKTRNNCFMVIPTQKLKVWFDFQRKLVIVYQQKITILLILQQCVSKWSSAFQTVLMTIFQYHIARWPQDILGADLVKTVFPVCWLVWHLPKLFISSHSIIHRCCIGSSFFKVPHGLN